MAIRKIVIRPPGTGNYADELHPKTSADQVVSTDGTIQGDIDALQSGKSDTTHNHSLANLTEKSYNSLTDKPTLGTAASKNTGTGSGNIPVLDGSGKLVTSILPALAITQTHPVVSEAAMLALAAQVGDVAIRSDLNKTFILREEPASSLVNWNEMLTPTDSVLSVNGQTGAVILDYADVGAAASGHNHTLAGLTEKSYNSLTDKPSIPDDTADLTKSDVYTKIEVDNLVGTAGYGDMMKATYDSNADGKVDGADYADTAPWTGISGKPSTFAPSAHNHTLSEVTDYEPPITLGTTQPTNGSLWLQEIV